MILISCLVCVNKNMSNLSQKQKIIISFVAISLMIIIIVLVVASTSPKKDKEQKPTTTTSPTEEIVEFPTVLPKTEAEKEETHEFAEEDKRFEKTKTAFYKKNPLTKYLPHYDDNFEVEYYTVKGNEIIYKVKLYVYLNDPNQFERYKEDYVKYKIEALEWIKSKKVDYKTLKIKWEPEDPKNISFDASYGSANVSGCKTCK